MSTNSGSSLALTCDSRNNNNCLCYIIYFLNFIFDVISFCIDKYSCVLRDTDVAYCVNSADTILALTATTHHIKRDVESSSSSSSSTSSSDDCTFYDELVFDGRPVKREKVLILKKVCDSLLKRKLIWFINVFQ